MSQFRFGDWPMASIADAARGRGGERCYSFIRHGTIAAARSLGLYYRGRRYTDEEVRRILNEFFRLFPPRGSE